LEQKLTEKEINAQSTTWLSESGVKKLANAVKDVLWPGAAIEAFVLSDRLGSTSEVKDGIKTPQFLNANLSIIYYSIRKNDRIFIGFLKVIVDRVSGQVQSIYYTKALCGFDEIEVSSLLAGTKGEIAEPTITSIRDKWGLCWPILTMGRGEKMEYWDTNEKEWKPGIGASFTVQNDSQESCRLIHNGEMLPLHYSALFFKPIVINGAPLIYYGYFPRFEIQVEIKQDGIGLFRVDEIGGLLLWTWRHMPSLHLLNQFKPSKIRQHEKAQCQAGYPQPGRITSQDRQKGSIDTWQNAGRH
jgi:hypothetical protein